MSGPCPTFLRALCCTASEGGQHSYKWAGYGLAGATQELQPWHLDEHQWEEEIDTLRHRIRAHDRAGIEQWYVKYLPRCMDLVPAPRRQKFVDGVLLAFEEERV